MSHNFAVVSRETSANPVSSSSRGARASLRGSGRWWHVGRRSIAEARSIGASDQAANEPARRGRDRDDFRAGLSTRRNRLPRTESHAITFDPCIRFRAHGRWGRHWLRRSRTPLRGCGHQEPAPFRGSRHDLPDGDNHQGGAKRARCGRVEIVHHFPPRAKPSPRNRCRPDSPRSFKAASAEIAW